MNRHSIAHIALALSGTLLLMAGLALAVSSRPGGQTGLLGPYADPPGTPGVSGPRGQWPSPRPDDGAIGAQSLYTLCLRIYTGTVRSTYVISNAGGVSGFHDRTLANFSQRLLKQSSTALEIEVITSRYLDTRAPYPVNRDALPGGVQPYLLPECEWVQSDDPRIVAKAQELVRNARRQAEAVDAIVAWVRGNIRYEGGHGSDALSVLTNGAGVCAGFSTLTAALLRAAGIPARYHGGCVTKWGEEWWWVVGPEGGGHAWNELYYPDAGWVALDPQVSTNYLDAGHILDGFDQCGQPGTVITRTSHQADDGYLYDLCTPYKASSWGRLWVANVPAWDRHPLRSSPALNVMLSIANPVGSVRLPVENRSCSGQDWQVRTAAFWLAPQVVTGTCAGSATFAVDASGRPAGFYSGAITLCGSSTPWGCEWAISRTISANLWLADEVYRVYLPMARLRD